MAVPVNELGQKGYSLKVTFEGRVLYVGLVEEFDSSIFPHADAVRLKAAFDAGQFASQNLVEVVEAVE